MYSFANTLTMLLAFRNYLLVRTQPVTEVDPEAFL